MSQDIMNRFKRSFVLILIALCVGIGIGLYQISNEGGAAGSSLSIPKIGSVIGGGFSLIDDEGQAVTEEDYAGLYKLIYFGFTYCPAVCPTELRKLSQAMEMLGKEGDQIQPLFITIDPERDTSEAMKTYVELFHPRLIGLTGSREQIDAAEDTYRVYAVKVPEGEEPDEYTMDHSSYIYFMSPDNKLISIFHSGDSAEDLAKVIRKVLSGV